MTCLQVSHMQADQAPLNGANGQMPSHLREVAGNLVNGCRYGVPGSGKVTHILLVLLAR